MNRIQQGLAGMKGWKDAASGIISDEADTYYMHLVPKEMDEGMFKEFLKAVYKTVKPGGELIILFVDARQAMTRYLYRGVLTLEQVRAMAFSGASAWGPEELYELVSRAGFIGITMPEAEEWPYNPTADPIYGMIRARKPSGPQA